MCVYLHVGGCDSRCLCMFPGVCICVHVGEGFVRCMCTHEGDVFPGVYKCLCMCVGVHVYLCGL